MTGHDHDFTDIFSPPNIARSRGRAAAIREQVASGEIGAEWLDIAAEVEAYADAR